MRSCCLEWLSPVFTSTTWSIKPQSEHHLLHGKFPDLTTSRNGNESQTLAVTFLVTDSFLCVIIHHCVIFILRCFIIVGIASFLLFAIHALCLHHQWPWLLMKENIICSINCDSFPGLRTTQIWTNACMKKYHLQNLAGIELRRAMSLKEGDLPTRIKRMI